MAELQFQVRDDRRQIRVAAALPITVHAALDVRETLLDGGQGVGDGHVGIVMGVDAKHAFEIFADVGTDLRQAAGYRASVGIAED